MDTVPNPRDERYPMKATRIASTVVTGIGALTIVAATIVAGTLAYASIKVPRTGRKSHV